MHCIALLSTIRVEGPHVSLPTPAMQPSKCIVHATLTYWFRDSTAYLVSVPKAKIWCFAFLCSTASCTAMMMLAPMRAA